MGKIYNTKWRLSTEDELSNYQLRISWKVRIIDWKNVKDGNQLLMSCVI